MLLLRPFGRQALTSANPLVASPISSVLIRRLQLVCCAQGLVGLCRANNPILLESACLACKGRLMGSSQSSRCRQLECFKRPRHQPAKCSSLPSRLARPTTCHTELARRWASSSSTTTRSTVTFNGRGLSAARRQRNACWRSSGEIVAWGITTSRSMSESGRASPQL